ncbi:DUF2000 domain-containing protein [Streptomyces sp. MMG1121]|uniref:DUF2000 domain-containing protein n=1 Tax=Streptomyces sp. MMG1121 TaxID=1415544 RepID=UPI0006B04236|nr:DUF2000 domain-containing protein [Streptomyces sp. MMG1121]KOV67881.1 hypothetical protein ADK64_08180 [Streptomyces sp. MMG1121]
MQTKVALVLREDLPTAHAANTSAVLALSLGGRIGDSVGRDGEDASGGVHPGLNTHPIPVLTASAQELHLLLERARTTEGVQFVSLTETARRARDYEDYLTDLKATGAEELEYLGVIVHGPRSSVSRLTRRFSLL